ncbi:hypothetical protein C8Q75DRAFT_546276 [Abortiporus biennis]|nr:hypothetical protein C8Q75DRAFT_546276 [Abortiporus biennis]
MSSLNSSTIAPEMTSSISRSTEKAHSGPRPSDLTLLNSSFNTTTNRLPSAGQKDTTTPTSITFVTPGTPKTPNWIIRGQIVEGNFNITSGGSSPSSLITQPSSNPLAKPSSPILHTEDNQSHLAEASAVATVATTPTAQYDPVVFADSSSLESSNQTQPTSSSPPTQTSDSENKTHPQEPNVSNISIKTKSGTRVSKTLTSSEEWWRDHYDWFQEHEFLLRSRYKPDWKPEWEEKDAVNKSSGRVKPEFEDGIVNDKADIWMDAICISNGKIVLLKRLQCSESYPDPPSREFEVTKHFSTRPWDGHPSNHAVPILEILKNVPRPNHHGSTRYQAKILVFPLLRNFNDPGFESVGEVVECLRQIFIGVRFMHQSRIVHGNLNKSTIVMDPSQLCSDYHPIETSLTRNLKHQTKSSTRTQTPTRYYLSDFSMARKPEEDKIFTERSTSYYHASAHEREEVENEKDLYKEDILALGKVIDEELLKTYEGLEFLQPLVTSMLDPNEKSRPNIEIVISDFNDLRTSLSTFRLCSPLTRKKSKSSESEGKSENVFKRLRMSLRNARRRIECTVRSGMMKRRACPVPGPQVRIVAPDNIVKDTRQI